jgi:NUMOD3 motif
MFFVYAHYRADSPDSDPFYIGKGKNIRDLSKKRNRFWTNIANKHGFVAKKLKENLTEQEAWDLEISLIAQYGKLIDNTGCLANITNGGEGASGTIHTAETKAKWSAAKKGKTWEEIYGVEQTAVMREKSKAQACKRIFSDETRRKLSEAKQGEKNPMYGKTITGEHSRKLSQAKIGKPSNSKGKIYDQKTRQRYREAAIIREADPAKRQKISTSLKGIKRSEETKRKMSEAAKSREANKKLSKLSNIKEIKNGK